MLRIFSILFLVSFLFSCNNDPIEQAPVEQACDNGTFIGDVILSTQQEVNEFGEFCYTRIDGNLSLIDQANQDPITDLTPLISISEITDESNPENLGGNLYIRTTVLTDLNGLNNLSSVSVLRIIENQNLIDLSGLSGLISIDGDNLTSFGGLDFGFNWLHIIGNPMLQSLNGLQNLTKVGKEGNIAVVTIKGNSQLSNIDSLSQLSMIGSASSPNDIVDIQDILNIHSNPVLENVNGLAGLLEVHGDIRFIVSCGATDLDVCGNDSLNDFCGIQNLLINGIYNDVYTGHLLYDGFSPSIDDIINGECSL